MTLHLPALEYDPWQKKLLSHKGHLLLCTGRQVGKTTVFAAKASQYMINHPNSRIIVVSLTEDQAQLMIVMILTYLEHHDKTLIDKKGNKKPTKNRVTLKNGAQVLARPVGNTGDAVRGFTGDVLIVDEASRMPEDMWHAAKPTLLTTGGEIWMCSTPHGKQGYFYECFQNKNNRWKVFHISSEEVIKNRKISLAWTQKRREGGLKLLEEEKADMSELRYAQEFLGQFIDDLRQFFSDELISKCCTAKRSQPAGGSPFLGVDIARMGDDASSYQIINRINEDKLIHMDSITKKKKLTTYTFDKIIELDKQWNFKKIGIDAGSGSLGVGIMDFLLRNTQVRYKIEAINNLKRELDHLGEKKANILKVDLYDNLKSLMEKGKIKLLNSDDVKVSLKSVQYEYRIEKGSPSRIEIFSNPHNLSDITEGIIRAAWLANQKHINTFIDYI